MARCRFITSYRTLHNLYVIRATSEWRYNVCDSDSNHQPHDCLLKPFIQTQIKENIKFRVTGLCAGNSPVAGEFPAQRASNAENVSIWWRHHEFDEIVCLPVESNTNT